MNYYRRYVGDYLRDTARLTMTEHGAYGLLLDYYYSDEKPLPLDHQELYLMLRAMRPEDRKAVDKVLATFFTAHDDGYHQKRVDHEIGVSKKARDNGKNGGRPKTETITGLVTGLVTGIETEQQTGCETETITGLVHPPTTNHQPPPASLQPPEKSKAMSGRPDAIPLNGRKAEALEVLEFLNEKTGRRYRPVPANMRMIEARLAEGASLRDCRQVVAKKAREWGADEKMEQYLRPATLFNATKFNQYVGELVPVEEPNGYQ